MILGSLILLFWWKNNFEFIVENGGLNLFFLNNEGRILRVNRDIFNIILLNF